MPTLSVVIPTKNEERYLPAVLESLKKQTLQPNEVIVADVSTDSTPEIARSFGARVVLGGLPSTGRNRGAAASTSDLIFFLDGDVIIRDDAFLEKAVKEFVLRDLDIATADVGVVDGIWFDHLSHAFYNWYARLMGSFHPHAPGFCILIKRSLHESIHGFSEDVVFCEDHEYAARACRVGKFGFLDSIKIFVTTRRQKRDGRLSMSVKYVLADLHLLFLGPIRGDKFKYGFEYESKK